MTQVATGLTAPLGIAVAGSTVYWTSPVSNVVQSAPVGGGTVKMVATGQTGAHGIGASPLNVFSTNTQGGQVMTLHSGAAMPTLISGTETRPLNIASDGVHLYWVDNTNMGASMGTVAKAPIAGGTVTVLVAGQVFPEGMAVDATSVYWLDVGAKTINKAPK